MNLSWPTPGGSRSPSEYQNDAEFFKGDYQQREGRSMFKKAKHRRMRNAFTTEQLSFLENEFRKGPYVSGSQRHTIAARLGLSDRCVKVWFQNRRMKEKYMNRGLEDDDDSCNKNTGSLSCPSTIAMPASHEQGMRALSHPILSHPNIVTDPNPYQNVNRRQATHSYHSLSSLEMSNPDQKIRELPGSVRLNYYQDISPDRDETPSKQMHTSQPPIRTNTRKSNSAYTSSAEFPIGLCKKYKSMLDSFKNDNATSETNITSHNPCASYNVIDLTKIEPQDTPEDLSMKKTNDIKQTKNDSASNLSHVNPFNSGAYPIYVNFAPPFASDGNVMWNNVTIPPVRSDVEPAASVSIVSAAPTSTPKNHYMAKNRCNCCRCPKKPKPTLPEPASNSRSEPQYVIKVLPLHNYPKF